MCNDQSNEKINELISREDWRTRNEGSNHGWRLRYTVETVDLPPAQAYGARNQQADVRAHREAS